MGNRYDPPEPFILHSGEKTVNQTQTQQTPSQTWLCLKNEKLPNTLLKSTIIKWLVEEL